MQSKRTRAKKAPSSDELPDPTLPKPRKTSGKKKMPQLGKPLSPPARDFYKPRV